MGAFARPCARQPISLADDRQPKPSFLKSTNSHSDGTPGPRQSLPASTLSPTTPATTVTLPNGTTTCEFRTEIYNACLSLEGSLDLSGQGVVRVAVRPSRPTSSCTEFLQLMGIAKLTNVRPSLP
ncbi:hypothetical protein L1887_60924 [Cichorium endivia]|nr:hypothetical protein L1887_60924 [Cichorium endivia]